MSKTYIVERKVHGRQRFEVEASTLQEAKDKVDAMDSDAANVTIEQVTKSIGWVKH